MEVPHARSFTQAQSSSLDSQSGSLLASSCLIPATVHSPTSRYCPLIVGSGRRMQGMLAPSKITNRSPAATPLPANPSCRLSVTNLSRFFRVETASVMSASVEMYDSKADWSKVLGSRGNFFSHQRSMSDRFDQSQKSAVTVRCHSNSTLLLSARTSSKKGFDVPLETS